MARITEVAAGGRNVLAMLDTIAWSELKDRILKESNDGYNVIVMGADMKLELFTDYSTHPFANGRKAKLIRAATATRKALYSSASGRYQFLVTHWEHYRKQLNLPDFGPMSQDVWALQLIKEQRAMDDIKKGKIVEAFKKCKNIWASLPGAGYGQHENNVDELVAYYIAAGGKLGG